MSLTSIEWTDASWNPVIGCEMISPGCAHCYAEVMAFRLRGMAIADILAGRNPGRKRHYIEAVGEDGRWTGNLIPVPEALPDPMGWKKPRRVFVNSMSDLFHEAVPFDFIDRVFAVMALCPQHTFQILTKRPERMAEWATREGIAATAYRIAYGLSAIHNLAVNFSWPLPNVWMGTSVENQATADERIPHLLKVPAAVRFLSCEPLLGPIDLEFYLGKLPEDDDGAPYPGKLDWAIIGGESGPGARPCDIAWVRSLVKQCKAADVAPFVKQLGAKPSVFESKTYYLNGWHKPGLRTLKLKHGKGGDMSEWPEDMRVREMPEVRP